MIQHLGAIILQVHIKWVILMNISGVAQDYQLMTPVTGTIIQPSKPDFIAPIFKTLVATTSSNSMTIS